MVPLQHVELRMRCPTEALTQTGRSLPEIHPSAGASPALGSQDRHPVRENILPRAGNTGSPRQSGTARPSRTLDRPDPFLPPISFGVVADQRSAAIEHVDDRRIDVDRVATATGGTGTPIDHRTQGAAAWKADRAIDHRHRMLPCVRNSVLDRSLANCSAGAQRRPTSSATARSSSAPCRSSTT